MEINRYRKPNEIREKVNMTELSDQNILFIARTMGLGGTENVILQLCEIFSQFVDNIVVCSDGGIHVEKLNNMGIKHYEIPDMSCKSIKNAVVICKRLKYIVQKERITVIHTHHRMGAFYVSLLKLYRKCYFINTSHNTFDNKIRLTYFSLKHGNLIACGEAVKKNLIERYRLPDRQIRVIHNAVKSFGGKVVIDLLIKDLHDKGYYVVGNIGRLSKQKGMEYYIKAIPDIINCHPEARFLIIGVGEDEEKLRRLVRMHDIEKYVFFMGYRNDIQNIMSQLDLIVLSSLWEGLPLTPIEAFSVGKCVIATAVDGTVEIVENGKTGILIEPRNSEQIADKVVWMIENPEERKKMEYAAKDRFLSKFSFEQLEQEYINYYKSILKRKDG